MQENGLRVNKLLFFNGVLAFLISSSEALGISIAFIVFLMKDVIYSWFMLDR